jgi:hypothetical protein
MVSVVTEAYTEQVVVWPKEGRHILAQFDARLALVGIDT